MKSYLSLAVPVLTLAGIAVQGQTGSSSATPAISTSALTGPQSSAAAENYGKLPLSFEINQGQTDARVKFTSRGKGYSLFLTDSAAVLSLTREDAPFGKPASSAVAAKILRPEARPATTDVVRMELTGAARGVSVTGADQLPGIANYFIGKDPAKWRSNVPTYAKVRYAGVYPGVDLVYYGNQRQLEYDFIVAPGANPKPVKLRFAGAKKLAINSAGDLTVSAPNGQIVFHKPAVYQMKDGQREPVDGQFGLLAKNTVGFRLGSYDHARQLVI